MDSGYGTYTRRICYVICFAITMLFFAIMFSLNYMADDSKLSGCKTMASNEPVYEFGSPATSKKLAKIIIESYLRGLGFEPDVYSAGTGIESCGPVFMLYDKSIGEKFFVCENGKAYKYVKICKDTEDDD